MRPGHLRRRYFNVTNHNPVPVNVFAFTAFPCRGGGRKDSVPGGVRVSLVSIRRPVERVLISGLVAAERINVRNLKAEVWSKAEKKEEDVLTTLESGYSAQFVAEINLTNLGDRNCAFTITSSIDSPSEAAPPADAVDGGASCKVARADKVFNDTMKFTISSQAGDLSMQPPSLRFADSFIGRVEEQPLCLTSSHHAPVVIRAITSTDPRFYGNITADTVPANGRLCFGVAVFDPSSGGGGKPVRVGEGDEGEKDDKISMHAHLNIQTSVRTVLLVPVAGTIVRPTILAKDQLAFPVTQLGKESEMWVELANPSNFSITARLAQHMLATSSADAKRPFKLGRTAESSSGSRIVYGHTILMQPGQRGRLGPVLFVPGSSREAATLGQTLTDKLSVVNNLTQSETVELKGKGGTGMLAIASADSLCAIPTPNGGSGKVSSRPGAKLEWCRRVFFSLTAAEVAPLLQLAQPSGAGGGSSAAAPASEFTLRKRFTARNSGNLPIAVTQLIETNRFLTGSAVRVSTLKKISASPETAEEDTGGVMVLQPDDEMEIDIDLATDFAVSQFETLLVISTSNGPLTIPIVVSIPSQLAAQCFSVVQRSEGAWWWGRLALGLVVTAKIVFGVMGEVMQLFESSRATPGVQQAKPKPKPQSQPTPRKPRPKEPAAVVSNGSPELPPRPTKRPSSEKKSEKKKKKERQPSPSHKEGNGRNPDEEIENWKKKHVMMLRKILPPELPEIEVQALLEEAEWNEETACDNYYNRQPKPKPPSKAEKRAQLEKQRIAAAREQRDVAATKELERQAQKKAEAEVEAKKKKESERQAALADAKNRAREKQEEDKRNKEEAKRQKQQQQNLKQQEALEKQRQLALAKQRRVQQEQERQQAREKQQAVEKQQALRQNLLRQQEKERKREQQVQQRQQKEKEQVRLQQEKERKREQQMQQQATSSFDFETENDDGAGKDFMQMKKEMEEERLRNQRMILAKIAQRKLNQQAQEEIYVLPPQPDVPPPDSSYTSPFSQASPFDNGSAPGGGGGGGLGSVGGNSGGGWNAPAPAPVGGAFASPFVGFGAFGGGGAFGSGGLGGLGAGDGGADGADVDSMFAGHGDFGFLDGGGEDEEEAPLGGGSGRAKLFQRTGSAGSIGSDDGDDKRGNSGW
eukprot:SAG11_NODE_96_length_17016_cov_18.755113_4_plen_1150_part_00